MIDLGVDYPVAEMSEEERLHDIEYMISRGNHQSSKLKENAAALSDAFDKEVKHGWAIPILPSCHPSSQIYQGLVLRL